MSSWAWKNDTLPANKTEQDVLDYHEVSWYNYDQLVKYPFGGEKSMETWLTSAPNRVNLCRVGLIFYGEDGQVQNITEAELMNVNQQLGLWTRLPSSTFELGEQTYYLPHLLC